MRAIIIATLLASLSVQAATPIPVSEVRVARDCDERHVRWYQSAPRPDVWEVEWRRMYVEGNAVRYERPLTFVVSEPEWRGRIPAGLYQVRVRGRYVEDGETKHTDWAESTADAGVIDGRTFVLSVHVCPPTDFEAL